MGNEYFGGNSDQYHKQGKIWETAERNNKKPLRVNRKFVKSCKRVPLV